MRSADTFPMSQQHFNFKNQQGFTRVSVFLGIVLAGMMVFTLSLLPQAFRSTTPPIAADQAVHEALQDSLRSFVKSKVVELNVPCADPRSFFDSHLFLRTYTGGIHQMRADPPAGLSAVTWDQLFNGSLASTGFAGAALSRCPLTLLGTGGRFHFCLNVQRDAHAPQDSFLHTPLIFAEVSIQLQDRRTGQNLSCAQYLDAHQTGAGATVNYLLFLVNERGGELEVSRKRGNLTVNR